MKTRKILVLGAGYAGIMAANRLAAKGGVDVILVNRSDIFLERIRNHQVIAGNKEKTYFIKDLIHPKIYFQRANVLRILAPSKKVLLEEGELDYDLLILALGVKGIPITDTKSGIYSIENEEDCKNLYKKLKENPNSVLNIVGGGLSGLETASELSEFFPGVKIRLLDSGKIGNQYSEGARNKILSFLKEKNIEIFENTKVDKFLSNKLILSNGKELFHDHCLLSIGLEASELGKVSGLEVNSKNQVKVNSYLQSVQYPEIFVTGDMAWIHDSKETYIRMACATAIAMGAYVANSVHSIIRNGKYGKPFSIGYRGTCLSLGRKDGVIQVSQIDDSPKKLYLDGRAGAKIKEWVCNSTISVMKWEQKFPIYSWPKGTGV